MILALLAAPLKVTAAEQNGESSDKQQNETTEQKTEETEETAPEMTTDLGLASPSVLLMEAQTGTVLYEKNASEQRSPASMRAHGVYNVAIRPCSGSLTDHYDPRDNSISLSENVYNSTSIAAVGVAAHEAGHAVQYAENYGPVRLRTAIIPATQIGSKFSFILLLVGMVLYSQSLFLVGILLFSLTTIFQLITLPVEFNASHRALQTLENEQLLYDDELPGARKVLKAAALTYVAALLMSALQLLRYVLIFVGRNNRGRRDN